MVKHHQNKTRDLHPGLQAPRRRFGNRGSENTNNTNNTKQCPLEDAKKWVDEQRESQKAAAKAAAKKRNVIVATDHCHNTRQQATVDSTN
jgi:hypothetical protein